MSRPTQNRRLEHAHGRRRWLPVKTYPLEPPPERRQRQTRAACSESDAARLPKPTLTVAPSLPVCHGRSAAQPPRPSDCGARSREADAVRNNTGSGDDPARNRRSAARARRVFLFNRQRRRWRSSFDELRRLVCVGPISAWSRRGLDWSDRAGGSIPSAVALLAGRHRHDLRLILPAAAARALHRAIALEDRALLDHQARGLEIAVNAR